MAPCRKPEIIWLDPKSVKQILQKIFTAMNRCVSSECVRARSPATVVASTTRERHARYWLSERSGVGDAGCWHRLGVVPASAFASVAGLHPGGRVDWSAYAGRA